VSTTRLGDIFERPSRADGDAVSDDAKATPRAELETVLRGVAEAITVQDREGRLVFANDAAARILGFPSSEALLAASPAERMAGFQVLDHDGAPRSLENLPGRLALAGREGEEQMVRYRLRETGEERWSIVRAEPILGKDGKVELAVNTFHDITDRVLAERRLADLGRVERGHGLDVRLRPARSARVNGRGTARAVPRHSGSRRA
jgi:PAS domain S-box-containing protein